MNSFKLTPRLKLLIWLIEHTEINNTRKPISNKEIASVYFKECNIEPDNYIYLLIGRFLNIIYGADLKKVGCNPPRYNIILYNTPIHEVFIRDYKEIYNINYFNHKSKKEFRSIKEAYDFINSLFKANNLTIKPMNLTKMDKLANDLILYCLNRGIPKKYLKYFFFYTMSFINGLDLNKLLDNVKKDFKVNKVCAICGASNNLTVHHVKKVSNAPYLMFNKNNMIVLCDNCHKKHHGLK